jgi:hypothetical protein
MKKERRQSNLKKGEQIEIVQVDSQGNIISSEKTIVIKVKKSKVIGRTGKAEITSTEFILENKE